ncbi:MAG: pilus assembly FimT family protein [Opitutales bacterium]
MLTAVSRRCGERPPRGAFTLIEILLVIALIALGATLVVVNFDAFGDDLGDPPLRVFRQVLTEARTRAAAEKRVIWIRFSEEDATLRIEDRTGRLLNRHPLKTGPDAPTVAFRFLSPPVARGTDPVGWPADRETLFPLARVACHPERWIAPFTLVLTEGETETYIPFDPFSAQPIEAPDNA